MSIDEAKEAISEMRAQGNSDEEIAGAFYLMFVDGKLDVNQFNALVNLLGYHLSDEFMAMDPEQQKTQGFAEQDTPEEGVTPNQVEAAKDDETNPFKEEDGGNDKAESNNEPAEKKEPETSSEDKPKEEDDEEEKAMRLFGK